MADPLRASELVEMLRQHIAESGDGVVQIEMNGNQNLLADVYSWHGRTVVRAASMTTFPFHRRDNAQ